MTLSSGLHTQQTSAIEIAFVHHPDAVNITASNECVTRVCGPFPGERSNDSFGETSNVGLNSSLKGSLKNTGDNSLFSWRYLASCPDDADGALRWSFLVRHCRAYQLHAAQTEVFVAGRVPFGSPCRLQNNSQVWWLFQAIPYSP